MIEIYEIYDKEKEYFTKDGQIYSYEKVKEDFPAVDYTKLVVTLYGRTVEKVETFDYLKGINRIKADVTDDEALTLIEKAEELKRTESTPLERIAAALEYLELVNMWGEES